VRSLREQAGLSLRQVEASTGVSNAYLSQIESGRVGAPSPKILERLARALNASYLDLLAAAGHLGPAMNRPILALGRPVLDVSELSEAERVEVENFVKELKRRRSVVNTSTKRGRRS
jgi:transcriptional regulator with XRE-family HTH domain